MTWDSVLTLALAVGFFVLWVIVLPRMGVRT